MRTLRTSELVARVLAADEECERYLTQIGIPIDAYPDFTFCVGSDEVQKIRRRAPLADEAQFADASWYFHIADFPFEEHFCIEPNLKTVIVIGMWGQEGICFSNTCICRFCRTLLAFKKWRDEVYPQGELSHDRHDELMNAFRSEMMGIDPAALGEGATFWKREADLLRHGDGD